MGKRIWSLLACLVLTVSTAFAQSKVTGTVFDRSTGETLIGATVLVKGSPSLGAATDINGNFTITGVPESAKHLVVSYIGMKTAEVSIRSNMKIFLEPQEALDNVLVVAYGTQKRSAFTGSATQINAEAIESHTATSVTSALAGAAPGVQMNFSNGDPASNSPSIRIRGIGSMYASSSPLVVLDGAVYEGSISSINPNDVASVSVLKDASASALYGSRGANGVILITTKKGRDQGAEIRFDAKWGSNSRLIPQYDVIDNPAEYIETAYKQMYNSQVYAGVSSQEAYAFADANILNNNNGGLGYQIYTVPTGQKLVGTNFKLNPNAKLGYSDGQYYYTPDDWYDETYHNSFRQEYNISLSGVTDRMTYFASGGYLNDGGLVDNSGFQRYTSRLNVEYQVRKWFKLSTNMSFTHTDSKTPSYTTDDYMSSGNLFYIVNNMAPIYPLYVRNADGSRKYTDTGMAVYDANQTNFKRPNTVGNAVRDNMYNRTKSYRDNFNGFFSAVFTPVKGLNLSANLTAYSGNTRTNRLYSMFASSSGVDGATSVTHGRTFSVTNQYLANYKTDFGGTNHHFEILAGYEQSRYKYQYLNGYNDHLYNPYVGELNNATAKANMTNSSYTEGYMNEGYLSRALYDYANKYFLNLSIRRDGSSRFAPGHRWGTFGGVGAAWDMSKEKFLESAKWIDLLKLKAAWGTVGNDNLDNYYGYATLYSGSYNETTGEYSKTLVNMGNDELTWETKKDFNLGLDFSFFNYRLNGGIEFFVNKTTDLLYPLDTPLSSGNPTGFVNVNAGSVVNRGLELSIDGSIFKTNNFEWSLNFNLTHYVNKIKSLHPSIEENGIRGSYRIYRVGGSIYNAYMYKYAGVDTEGKALYYYEKPVTDDAGAPVLDADGNQTYETATTTEFANASRYDCGTTLPDVYGGFGTSLKFYGFDVTAQFGYQFGGRIYDGTYQALMHTSDQSVGNAWHRDALNAWSADNPNSTIPRLDTDYSIGQAAVDRFQINSDYLSLNTFQVGYTLPKIATMKLGISSLRVYVAGENLFVLSARKGLDPRFSLGTGSYVYGSGSSSNYYSTMRTITAGITLSF